MKDEDDMNMVLNNIIEVGLKGNKRIPYYREKGIEIPTKIDRYGREVIDCSQKLYVKLEDMPKYSEAKVTIKCDYQEDGCRDVYQKNVGDYIKNTRNSVVKKDCCSNRKCQTKKTAECNLINYGFEFHLNQPEFKKKIESTNIERYGNKTLMGSDHFKKKTKITVSERYGVENISQLEEVKIKKAETFYKNGTVATSRQQRYIHRLIGGELNYADNTPSLDIAFPDEKVYIEYHGSGHWLNVQLGQITEDEFIEREKRRHYYLKSRGWKEISIISRKDKIPDDSKIIQMISYAKNYLNKGHSWIHFDVDNGKVISSEGEYYYSFGFLRSYQKFRKDYRNIVEVS